MKTGNKGRSRSACLPPVDVVKDLLAFPGWSEDVFPPLDEIIEAPVFASDGTLVAQPGYDRDSRLWYSPTPGLIVPGVPGGRPNWDRSSWPNTGC